RAVLLADGDVLTPALLPPEMRRTEGDEPDDAPPVELGPDGLDLESLERTLLEEALRRTGGNRTEAGRLLGLSRHQIRNRLHKYGLVDA
ncbi:MAG: sigma-54-dependent Fis family transcriptional regulator, partial [Myxococcales bacterium]|nr:sigma-54-dependent Fis family transcriptional regulator [Myxococcales bacterium]